MYSLICREISANQKPQFRGTGRGLFFSVGNTSVSSGDHENDLLCLINLIKKPPATYSVPPCFRFETFELLNIWPEMGMLSELGINKFIKFRNNLGATRPCNLPKVSLKLLGFEDSVFTQQNALYECEPPGSPY